MFSKCLLLISAILLIVFATEVSAEETEYEDTEYEDMGTFYGYTLQFVYTGEYAQSVTWDFGDGSSGEGVCPVHTYSDTGTFFVTQKATNDFEGKPNSVAVYRVTIAGYPWIEFDSNGGTDVPSVTMESGGRNAVPAVKPENPTRVGYSFGEWYTDPELTQPYNWNSVVTEPLTLYASWIINVFTVSFDAGGGSGTESQSVPYGGTVSEPVNPVREGYTFEGWYLDGVPYDFSSPVTESVILTAHWLLDAAIDDDVSDSSEGTETAGTEGKNESEEAPSDGADDNVSDLSGDTVVDTAGTDGGNESRFLLLFVLALSIFATVVFFKHFWIRS